MEAGSISRQEAPELLTLLIILGSLHLLRILTTGSAGQEWAGTYICHSVIPTVSYFSGEGLLGARLLM